MADAWIELKCWNETCHAPLSAIPKAKGWVTTKCRICGEEIVSWVQPEKTPHGGEGWSVTPHETTVSGRSPDASRETP